MTVLLPQPISASAGWQQIDWLVNSYSSQPAAGGMATITCDQLDGDTMWLIDHMVVSCTSGGATALRLYDSVVSPVHVLDGTDAGNFAVGEWPAGLMVRSSSSLIAQWTGATDGAIGLMSIQARILRRG